MQTSSFLSRLVESGFTRRSAIVLWCISSSLFLFYFSVASSTNEKNLLLSYLNFSAILFGGGLSYHITIELLKIEQHKKNERCWRALLTHLLILQAGYLATGLAIYSGVTLGGTEGLTLALISLAVGYLWVFHYLISSMKKIERLFGIRWFVSTSNKGKE